MGHMISSQGIVCKAVSSVKAKYKCHCKVVYEQHTCGVLAGCMSEQCRLSSKGIVQGGQALLCCRITAVFLHRADATCGRGRVGLQQGQLLLCKVQRGNLQIKYMCQRRSTRYCLLVSSHTLHRIGFERVSHNGHATKREKSSVSEEEQAVSKEQSLSQQHTLHRIVLEVIPIRNSYTECLYPDASETNSY